MTLHCACRLGILDQLYQQRHAISHAIGLIEEIPIAMCNSDYDFSEGLVIETQQEDSSVPAHIVQANEINLFFYSYSIPPLLNNSITLALVFTLEDENLLQRDFASVFHPPAHG